MAEEKPTPNQKLRSERIRRGWSQQDVADKVGTTPLNVGRWERGVTAPGPHFRQKLSQVFEKSLDELGLVARADESLAAPSSISSKASKQPTSAPDSPGALWNVPYRRNPFFTGREDILHQLRETLLAEHQPVALSQPQAITGLGGIGKTQTAIEYAYRYREVYQAVFWARAESRDLLISDFLTIATLLELPQRYDQEQEAIVQAVIRWLDSHQGWLLILDNADNLEIAGEFLPSAGAGHVLLTTRAHSLGTFAQRIDLEKMNLEEGMRFLLRRAKQLKGSAGLESISESVLKQAHAIAEMLDGLPLALDQAGAYIEETGCSLNDYLKYYRTRQRQLLRIRGKDVSGHPESVATALSLAFEKVEQANPAAAELLRLCAFLHPDEIPERMIMDGASELGPIVRSIAEDELEWNEAIGELRRYSLVKRDPEKKILNLHRLVQAVIKDRMDGDVQRGWAESAVKLVNKTFPETNFEAWPLCQQYLPHAKVCAALIEQWDMRLVDAAHLLDRTGEYLYGRAQYREAEPLYIRALTIWEQLFGLKNSDIAVCMNHLAELYRAQGKATQAEPLYQHALLIWKEVLGPNHPLIVTGLNNLGQLYNEQGSYTQAELLFQQALTIGEQTLGADHADVATVLNNLGLLYYWQSKFAQAESFYQRALSIWEQVLGPNHPDVAVVLNNLAWIYWERGKYTQAEVSHLRALAIREHNFGPHHPDVAESLNGLTRLYHVQRKYNQAEPLCQRALFIREQTLGPDHLKVAQSLNALALLYYAQRKYEQAEPLFQRALDIREQTLEQDNIDVAYSLHNIAMLYRDQGKLSKAEEFFQRALAIRKKLLGEENSRVAQTLYDMALLHQARQEYTRAESLFMQALAIYERTMGPDHPDVATTLESYAELLRKTNRENQALALEKRAQAIREKKE